MRKLLCYFTLLFTLVYATGCQRDTAAPDKADPSTVIVAMGPTSEPEGGFDPAYGWGCGEHVHEPLIQSTLTVTTPNLEIAYDLATDMAVSEDGLLWTIKIREDAYFTDGTQLTASDVAFTYNNMKVHSVVADFTMLDYAKATDSTTVLLHMNKPYSAFAYTMASVGIVPEHLYTASYGENPIGSGRYRLKQWEKGQQIILEKNPDYYGQAPLIDRVVVVFLAEDAAYAAVQSGSVDLAYTAPSYAGSSIAGYNLLAVESVDNRGFNLPAIPDNGNGVGNNVTADAAIRQAFNIGIDRERIIELVLDGYGSPAYSVCDKMPWFNEASVVAYDPVKAAGILDEAGWALDADGIRAKEGLRAELNILYPTGDSLRQAIAAETASQLKALGIAATTEGVGWDTAYARAQSQVMTWGWGAHSPMELYNIYHTKAYTGLAVYSPYANKAVDSYMDQALKSSDLTASYALWQMAQYDGADGITQDLPWVWVANVDHLYWVRDSLTVAAQKIHPHGHGWSVVNNIDQWLWQ